MNEKIWDFIELVSSIIFVTLLLSMLSLAMIYFKNHYPLLLPIDAQMFYIAVGIAIVTVSVQWIEGRVKVIIRTWNNLKGGNNGRGKTKKARNKAR